MSVSPHSSLSTPIPPPRAPPSPPDSIASFSTGSLNPNAGDFVPTSFGEHRELDIHVPSSPSSASVQSSPGSSSSTSVSFTLAPSSQSVSSFASITSTPSLSYITPSTTQSSFSSYHSLLDSPNQTPHGFKRPDPFEEADIDSHHSDDAGRPLLRSLHRGIPSTADIEPGEITTSSATNAATVALPSSPEVVPPGPPKKATYVPLPDIEIHQAAPSTFMNHSTANSARGSTPVTDDGSQDLSDKTPNVYINGLPPNFPEDQLFELAIPFGEVKSVRSFTRHVGEKESGYGFVLFETIESAEKCIHALRRFRNLHPTFSKVHKIPGTSFSQPASTQSLSQNQSSMDDETFKNKMERLHDPTSTNLYLEGLPLSIDEPSLGALMAPHRIKSSRLFQTRLSNPPRIIAFVRLDTRAGAEDVIERLHGRMVRGWNDPGSRISVRFADTAEQRELRRTERSGKEDDPSPSRLTIAQAALLNLHGRDQYRVPPPAVSVPRRAAPPPIGVDYGQLRSSYHDLSSNAADAVYQDEIVLPPSHNAHNVLPGQSMSYDRHAMHGSSGPSNQELTPAAVALLNSLRGTNLYAGEDAHYGALPQHNATSRTSRSLTHAQLQLLNGSHRNIEIDESGDHYPVIGGTGQARNGFTATEEYILQAHAQTQNQRRRPNRLDVSQTHGQPQLGDPTNLNLGVRGIRAQASNVSLPHRTDCYQSPRTMGGSLPALQEEFQTSRAQGPLRDLYTRNGIAHNGSPDLSDRGYSDLPSHNSQTSASNASRTSSQTTNRSNHNTQAHVRSSTLPPHSTPSSDQIHSRHYQHSSMSIPKSRNITSEIMRATSQRVQHRNNNSINSIASGDTAMYSESKYPHDAAHPRHQNSNMKNGEKHAFDSFPNATFPDPDVYDVEQSSPPLVSPALTYSSRGSGATLSPSTPFMGSFSQSQGVSVEGSG